MSDLTLWIAVDGWDGEANLSDEKPTSREYDEPEGGHYWHFDKPDLCHRLGYCDVDTTIFGVGRGQCREFKLVPVGDIIDGKEAT